MSIFLFGCAGKSGGGDVASKAIKPPAVSCTDDCSPSGSVACVDINNSETCGNYDEDSCLEWGNIKYCNRGCYNNTCNICTPNCAGKQCGNDGCGGSCGTCPKKQACKRGVCRPRCADTDKGKVYNITGSVKLGGVVKATDSCATNLTLKEWYCSSSTAYTSVNYDCQNIKKVCSGGACK